MTDPNIPLSPFATANQNMTSEMYKQVRQGDHTKIAQTANKYKEALMEIQASVDLAHGDAGIKDALPAIISGILEDADIR